MPEDFFVQQQRQWANDAVQRTEDTFNRPLGATLLGQSRRESGWHSSPSDDNKHLTIKNSDGRTTGHYYEDGSIKSFGELGGGTDWLVGKPKSRY